MVTPKSQQAVFVLCAAVILSAVYAFAAYGLLRPVNDLIRFTASEIDGVRDYKTLSDDYFTAALAAARGEADGAYSGRAYRENLREVGDRSNLILDPELPSYYAVSVMFNDIPLIVEHILTRRNDGGQPHDFDYALNALTHSVASVCKADGQECALLGAQVAAFKESIAAGTQNTAKTDAAALVGKAQSIAVTATQFLDRYLQRRLAELTHTKRISLASVGGLYLVLAFLSAFSLVNFVRKRELKLARQAQDLAAKLAKKNDELDKFAHAAAHDLKEPVRTICCYATLLKGEMPAGARAEIAEYLGIIEGAAKRSEQMINDLLGYAQAGETALVSESCDCERELATVLQDMRSLLEAVRPEIKCGKMPVLPFVPSMFRRLMTNLLDNAVKYRQADVPLVIKIRAAREKKVWHFAVQDNGIGIDEQHVEAVFEPFRRLHVAPDREGQGIGLTSCRKIVERVGGAIWVTSVKNVGTTVHFTLPVRAG